MSKVPKSFVSTAQLNDQLLENLFSFTKEIKLEFNRSGTFERLVKGHGHHSKVIALIFFEPSTRTRLSFELAALRLGCGVLNFDQSTSSVQKGESLVDSFRNIAAMKPDLMVVRHGFDPDLEKEIKSCPLPLISAGQGAIDHPTQALLDAFTLQEHFGSTQGRKV